MYAYIMVPEGCVFTVLGSLLCPHSPFKPHYTASLRSTGSQLRFSFHILVIEPIERAAMRRRLTAAFCFSPKLFLIVFRGNHCDMSVRIVNIIQRKYYKDITFAPSQDSKCSLSEAELYLFNPLTKEKWLLGNKVNKRD